MSQKVPLALSSCCNSAEGGLCKNIEGHVLKAWIVVHASQPDYIMARLVFSAFFDVVVTVCLVLLVVKWIYIPWLIDAPMERLVYAIQFAFVVVGSIVVVFRWLTVIFYSPKDVRCLLDFEDF
jgi:ABC-type antimicrobial peptide transport system permease subunit